MADFKKIDSETGLETTEREIYKTDLLQDKERAVSEITFQQKMIDKIDVKLNILK